MTQSEYLIETQNLTKRFGDLTAVNKINIKIRKGTIHGFIGPNGAGKTTTMKMLIGALKPTEGSATIKGYKIGSLESRKIFGFSAEHPKFYEDMPAFDYLVYMGRVSGLSKQEADQRAMNLLKWLDLDDFANKKVGGFSAGMRQKLSLAQAMIHKPELLILDEPTANLDPAGRLNIIKKLLSLCKKEGVTVFISSHILAELEKMVDEVTIISHGTIVTESGVKDLKAKFAGNEYLLKTSNTKEVLSALKKNKFVHDAHVDERDTIHIMATENEAAFQREISKVLASNNAALEAFGIASSDLERVFMELVGESEQRMEGEKKSFKSKILGKFRRKK
ncbi:MAG: ABC transporter ATP-binding protein [Candidatus Woesearchaeota archaeon]|nr:MAG: ABC transporter ATP-binding protein [Candidatus Woesearchaeota archaeon]